MKKNIIVIFLFIFASQINGQNSKTGIIYYDYTDNHYSVSYNSYLVFNENRSHFVTAKDSLGLSGNARNGNRNEELVVEVTDFNDISKTRKNGLQVFSDRLKDSIYSTNAFSLISKIFYVKEKRPKLDWTFENDTKKVGKFNCKKATVKFRGRKYICWYTEEIPLSYGPWKLQGLPGIILEARSEDNFFIIKFKKIKYPVSTITVPNHQNKLLAKNKKFISLKEYILKQKNEIKRVDNYSKIMAKKYKVKVHPFSERDNFLEIFGQ